jgi:hypothetical protein
MMHPTFSSSFMLLPPTSWGSQLAVIQCKCVCGNRTRRDQVDLVCRHREGMLQGMAMITPSPGNPMPAIVHEVLRLTGQPLDTAARAFLELRSDYNFSQERAHADARAVYRGL